MTPAAFVRSLFRLLPVPDRHCAACLLLTAALPCQGLAEPVRVAQYNTGLGRDAPGLLWRDIVDGDPQVTAIARIIAHTSPDILLLNEFDYDAELLALSAFADLLRAGDGPDYPYLFALPVNSGVPSGVDLDGDGRTNRYSDAFGFGQFSGQNGMAILSRFPIDTTNARSFATLLWRDLPGANLPRNPDLTSFLGEEALAVFRLSSKSHWDVPVLIGETRLRLLASHPTPPVFDGPEDLNGWRNHDEIAFWSRYLDGMAFTDDQGRRAPGPETGFVLLGTLNADSEDGDGRPEAIRALLAHPALTDPRPTGAGGMAAAADPRLNAGHGGDPALDTTLWTDPDGPGNLRVDYLLPSRDLEVLYTGVFWPDPEDPAAARLFGDEAAASDHFLLWVDLKL